MSTRLLATSCLVVVLSCSCILAATHDTWLADAAEKLEAAKSDAANIHELLDKQADPNAAQVDGMTALHWAVYHDDTPLAKLLVSAGADVTAANRYGVTPLSLACSNGNSEIVELLLEGGSDPNTTLRGGETALMTAARTGVLGPVKALLSRKAIVNAKERKGQTALMWAAAEGHADVVQVLIDAGADFQSPLPSGFTPLLFAVREGRTAAVKVLLQAGANVNQPMQPTKKPSNRPVLPGTAPLILAVENGHFDLAVVLLDAGADPNDQRSGFAPLHTMSWVRKPNRGDGEDGDPPPTGSGSLSSLQFVEQLVGRGANVNLQLEKNAPGAGGLNKVGATPFLLAAATADTALMQKLVQLGADPLLPNAENSTPLLAAAGVGTRALGEEAGTESEVLEALEFLLKLGGDINAVDKNGETAMHGAAYKGFPKVVQFLAEKGAKIEVWNTRNKRGWTPLSIAEGHRPGNFLPSAETIDALHSVMSPER